MQIVYFILFYFNKDHFVYISIYISLSYLIVLFFSIVCIVSRYIYRPYFAFNYNTFLYSAEYPCYLQLNCQSCISALLIPFNISLLIPIMKKILEKCKSNKEYESQRVMRLTKYNRGTIRRWLLKTYLLNKIYNKTQCYYYAYLNLNFVFLRDKFWMFLV